MAFTVACGGGGTDDRDQIEDISIAFFEGLTDGDCDELGDALAEQRQIPEGQCRDFLDGLERRFTMGVAERFGGPLDEVEFDIDDVNTIDIEGQDDATARVVVHLTFRSDGDLSEVFGIDGAEGEVRGEVNVPTVFAYAREGDDWKITEPFLDESDQDEDDDEEDQATTPRPAVARRTTRKRTSRPTATTPVVRSSVRTNHL